MRARRRRGEEEEEEGRRGSWPRDPICLRLAGLLSRESCTERAGPDRDRRPCNYIVIYACYGVEERSEALLFLLLLPLPLLLLLSATAAAHEDVYFIRIAEKNRPALFCPRLILSTRAFSHLTEEIARSCVPLFLILLLPQLLRKDTTSYDSSEGFAYTCPRHR